MNPPAEFIIVVLHHIYNIYLKEFDDKKAEFTPKQREQIKVEDIFDEYDKQLIEDLSSFLDQY